MEFVIAGSFFILGVFLGAYFMHSSYSKEWSRELKELVDNVQSAKEAHASYTSIMDDSIALMVRAKKLLEYPDCTRYDLEYCRKVASAIMRIR